MNASLRIPPPLSLCLSCGSDLIYGAWRVLVWSEDAVVGKGFCGGEEVRIRVGEAFTAPSSSVFLREVEAPVAPPSSVQFPGGGGLPSSVVAVLLPEGGGYYSSTLPA
ncbi:hypothetical protein HID58_012901 [Brassica napus]|uniref:Uncharacterized protein n=1 Tax=Brassica napus TaxID=3708 RepID=A0ABQ8E2D4_BRANA|nr:hypothetical protein HID58_012901 [Brassica napus]